MKSQIVNGKATKNFEEILQDIIDYKHPMHNLVNLAFNEDTVEGTIRKMLNSKIGASLNYMSKDADLTVYTHLIEDSFISHDCVIGSVTIQHSTFIIYTAVKSISIRIGRLRDVTAKDICEIIRTFGVYVMNDLMLYYDHGWHLDTGNTIEEIISDNVARGLLISISENYRLLDSDEWGVYYG